MYSTEWKFIFILAKFSETLHIFRSYRNKKSQKSYFDAFGSSSVNGDKKMSVWLQYLQKQKTYNGFGTSNLKFLSDVSFRIGRIFKS